MDYIIREINEEEIKLLDRFLYLAIYVHKGEVPPPFGIIYKPELQVYVENLGKEKDDHILIAEADDKIVGAVWVRIMDDYGHIDDETPSLIISVEKEYRGKGIGRSLLSSMLSLLSKCGYKAVSLSCQKENYAVSLYKSLGFEIIKDIDEEYIMRKSL
ncbi:MAG: GNAT family N-acetyltransferase [Spirochaetales bacterium]|nr:GNAT family N-acetyltransferase [Spirochaetales bacterium]